MDPTDLTTTDPDFDDLITDYKQEYGLSSLEEEDIPDSLWEEMQQKAEAILGRARRTK